MISRNRPVLATLTLALLLALAHIAPAAAVPSDIVPTGSTLLDSFATLAKTDKYVGANFTPFDFLGDRLWSRGELARILERNVLADPDTLTAAEQSAADSAALRAIVVDLRPELKLDGFDAGAIARTITGNAFSYDGYGKIEGRDNTEANSNKNGQLHSGVNGIYRATIQGDLSSNARYAIEASNWTEDYRRVYNNDLGPHDFSGLQEAYVEIDGNHGLRFDIGRMYDRWGPAYRGATMQSDNAPPFDQVQISFPFSLGQHLGRNYSFNQMATIYSEFGSKRYEEARRVSYQFNKKWEFDVQESFKSIVSNSLLYYSFVPFDIGRGFQISQAQNDSKYKVNFTLSYSPKVSTRFYGQFLIDDIKGPFTGGRLLGFELGNTNAIVRKVAYIVGAHVDLKHGSAATLEYDYADPITYTFRNLDAIWQHGNFDWIGLPAGPDSREIYARFDQRFGKPLNLSLSYRDRWRNSYSWISPTAQALTAEGQYQFGNDNSLGLTYTWYRQDPYPFVVDAPGSPVISPYAYVSEGYYGQRLRASEFDISFAHAF